MCVSHFNYALSHPCLINLCLDSLKKQINENNAELLRFKLMLSLAERSLAERFVLNYSIFHYFCVSYFPIFLIWEPLYGPEPHIIFLLL
jgi:hypothetical protein